MDNINKWVTKSVHRSKEAKKKLNIYSNYYYYTRLTASFPRQPGQAGTRKVKPVLDLNEARDDGVLGCSNQLNHMQTIVIYRLDALPDAQPTASKYWRQILPSYLLQHMTKKLCWLYGDSSTNGVNSCKKRILKLSNEKATYRLKPHVAQFM